MPRVINFSSYSFSAKLALSLLTLAICLLTILFVLIIPNMQKENYKHEVEQVEQTIALNTQQLKLAVDYIINDGIVNNVRTKNFLEFELHKIHHNLDSLENTKKYLEQKSKDLMCDISLYDKNKNTTTFDNKIVNNDGFIQFKKINANHDVWHVFIKKDEENFCPSITKHIVYSQSLNNNNSLLISCNTDIFYDHENNVEKKIKEYIQKSFSYTNHIHKGNTFLMWMNVDETQINDNPLYDKNDKPMNNKYCISKLSNVNSIKTGLLSSKQILEAANKEPIIHMMNKEDDLENYKYQALTWVRSINEHPSRRLIFITTVYEEDLHKNIDSVFWKILPAALLALFISIITGFLIFRKFSKGVDVLVKTSREVRHGNLNLRSNITGSDHIAVLGRTFDLMLDSMQNNIKDLDSKVESRTVELQKSLDEKNILLKEIHHRVKNNLAFTINLIKLQKRKVSDENTKELLTDVQERIYIMELLHRKLYESKDLNSIPFKKYVHELVEDITMAYNINDLDLKLEVDDVFMDIEHALPCGLIINECITNSFKYAFTNDNNKFSLKFKKEDKHCTLEIKDNGEGLPKDLDIYKTKSLGLRLITSISKAQLLGSIEYKNDGGVCYIIKFDIE